MSSLPVLALVASLAAAALAAAPAPPVRIILVGDSTVTDASGWGSGFKQFAGEGVGVTNVAQNGRSSKSFIDEGRWEQALALKGDYYLIQFGHNDQPGKGPDRETDPATTFPRNLARFVDEARAIGAKPVLVTSLTRRTFDPASPGRIASTLTPHVEAMKRLAAEKNVPLIDLHARSGEFCERIGPAGAAEFNPVGKGGKPDTTHLNAAGSVAFARLVVEELRQVLPALGARLRTDPVPAAAPPAPRADAIVSFDGAGTHTTVQAAVDAAPAGATKPFVILIKPGRYKGHVAIPAGKPFILLQGEEKEAAATILTDDPNVGTLDADGKKFETRDSATVLVEGDNFTAENLTFENTTTREQGIQALALYADADRVVFRGCRFLGWQDTVRAEKGRQYFRDCTIEGYVDFIYGNATAVFDHCTLVCKADGFLTAPSTLEGTPFGFVFLDCKVEAGPAVQNGFYLGRPWRPFGGSAFIRTALPSQVRPEGWHNWDKPGSEKTARFVEYRSTGDGKATEARVTWARQLTLEESKAYTVGNVLRGSDGWIPAGE